MLVARISNIRLKMTSKVWQRETPANIRLDEDVFCLRVQKTSSRRLQDVLIKINIIVLVIRLQDVFKTSCQDIFKTSCKNVFKTSSRRLQDVFKTSSRHLQDLFKTFSKRITKLNCSC